MPISVLISKMTFIKYLPPARSKLVPKLNNNQDLLKFGTFDISNIPISILISKIISVKYLPAARSKLVPKC